MLKEERDCRERSREIEERRRAALDGENPDEVLLRKKREKELAEKKAEFEEKRRQKHVEIVSKLLEEQEHKKKSERLASKPHWEGRWPLEGEQQMKTIPGKLPQKTHGFKRSSRFRESEGVNPVISANNDTCGEGDIGDGGSDSDGSGASGAKCDGVRADKDVDEVLTKPEIDGLWNQKCSKEARTDGDEEESGDGEKERRGRGKGRSKLEQKILTDVVDNLKQSVFKKQQVVAGREFKVSHSPPISLFASPEMYIDL